MKGQFKRVDIRPASGEMDLSLETLASDYLPGALLLVAAAIDLRTHRIPNPLVLVFFLVALGLQISMENLGQTLADSGLMLVIGIGLFGFGVMGAGDGKLLVALTAFVGLAEGLWALVWAILIGALVSVLILIARKEFYGFFGRTLLFFQSLLRGKLERELLDERKRYPFAWCIGLGWLGTHLGLLPAF